MNELQIFTNPEFGEIRTINEDGNVLFCGKDVALSLGYKDTTNAIKQHCKGVVKRHLPTPGGNQVMNFIPEGDIYRLAAKSELPDADRFESWVFDEILPAVRKTGGYVANDDLFVQTYLPYADEQSRDLFRATLTTIRNLNAKIEQDKPKVLFADAVSASKTSILVGDLAKLLKQNGIEVGQKRLFSWLRDKGYLIKTGGSKNMPTQRAMEMGLFEVKEGSYIDSHGNNVTTKTTKVTGKGQLYFVNKFLDAQAPPPRAIQIPGQ